MKKTLLICTAGLLSFYLSAAKAQTDTTKYDLGRVQMDKNLTQSITIKGADLEKMPFSDLSVAINTWLYGVYGSPTTYVPVVDGVMMTDINTLSIFDIDEITLVQNAATTLNGVSPQQLLLLIKTKRNHDGKKHGIEAAGQTNIISLHTDQAPANAPYTVSSALRFYNQYYLSGYVNADKIHAGVSADFQRDGMPAEKVKPTNGGPTINSGDAASLNRYRFNGYLDASLGKSTLSINTGYVPQTGNDEYESTFEMGQEKIKQNLYYGNVSLKSSFSGFQNTLTGSYEHYKNTNNEDFLAEEYDGYGYELIQGNQNSVANTSNYTLKDNLSRKFKAGNWEFEPNVNLMYRNYKTNNATSINESVFGQSYYNMDSTANTGTRYAEKITTLTPALSINYHHIIAIQGGFETILSNNSVTDIHANSDSIGQNYNNKSKKLSPFFSATLNAIGRNKDQDPFVLSLFGSYAKMASTALNSSANSLRLASAGLNGLAESNLGSTQWQYGTNISLWRNRLAFSYAYAITKYNTVLSETYYYVYQDPYGNYYYPPVPEMVNYNSSNRITTHRLGFDINWKKTEQFSWKTNLNVNFVKTMFDNETPLVQNDHFTTGGLINRLDGKKTFAGIDILYLFQGTNSSGAAQMPHYHAFNLQNLYYGKRFKINGDKTLEVFANMRSIMEDRSPSLLDYSKYYGLGFKLGI